MTPKSNSWIVNLFCTIHILPGQIEPISAGLGNSPSFPPPTVDLSVCRSGWDAALRVDVRGPWPALGSCPQHHQPSPTAHTIQQAATVWWKAWPACIATHAQSWSATATRVSCAGSTAAPSQLATWAQGCSIPCIGPSVSKHQGIHQGLFYLLNFYLLNMLV